MNLDSPRVAPARLHVMLARDAPFATILRRGPSKQVCSIGWNLSDDTFHIGQWLKGRVYESGCDLSPDGRHLLYHSVKHRLREGGWLEYSVLSRAPYLKALKIWKGKGFYGGVFLDQEYFVLYGYEFPGTAYRPKIFRAAPFGEVKNEPELARIQLPEDVQLWRFQRDGWHGANALKGSSNLEWLKEFAGWELKLTTRDAQLTYAVQGRRLGEYFNCARWQWADFRDGRLLWAQDGKIFAAPIWQGGHGPATQLADFNAWAFEPIVAPY